MKLNVKRHAVVQPQDQSIRLIPLTQGQNAIVDAADYPALSRSNWFAVWNKHIQGFYAARAGDNYSPMVFMHRELLQYPYGDIDHENRNGLDNRRKNIRPCSRSQNIANTGIHKDTRTGLRGITRSHAKWRARIVVGGREINIGSFTDKEAAARAYDAAALTHFGEFAHLNFPK